MSRSIPHESKPEAAPGTPLPDPPEDPVKSFQNYRDRTPKRAPDRWSLHGGNRGEGVGNESEGLEIAPKRLSSRSAQVATTPWCFGPRRALREEAYVHPPSRSQAGQWQHNQPKSPLREESTPKTNRTTATEFRSPNICIYPPQPEDDHVAIVPAGRGPRRRPWCPRNIG